MFGLEIKPGARIAYITIPQGYDQSGELVESKTYGSVDKSGRTSHLNSLVVPAITSKPGAKLGYVPVDVGFQLVLFGKSFSEEGEYMKVQVKTQPGEKVPDIHARTEQLIKDFWAGKVVVKQVEAGLTKTKNITDNTEDKT